jgi:RNA polymerase sigma-70 factor (ECF subfamily)
MHEYNAGIAQVGQEGGVSDVTGLNVVDRDGLAARPVETEMWSGSAVIAHVPIGHRFIMTPILHQVMTEQANPRPTLKDAPAASGTAESSFALLLRAKTGDDDATNRLFARYLPRVRRWAHGRLPASSRSLLNTDDLAQDVLLRAIASLDKFEPRHEGAFQGFLRQIILNRVRDEVRSTGRRPSGETFEEEAHIAHDPSPMEIAIGQEALERYERALQRLRPQDRELIVARCELDFSAAEIATIFDKPTAEAAQRAVGRALVRLAEEMARG